MAYFAMIYDLVDDYMARRGAFREQHLKMAADAHTRGELILGGAFSDPPDKAMMIFCAKDSKVAESFARTDPYVLNGLVKHWEVRPWIVVIGNTEVG